MSIKQGLNESIRTQGPIDTSNLFTTTEYPSGLTGYNEFSVVVCLQQSVSGGLYGATAPLALI